MYSEDYYYYRFQWGKRTLPHLEVSIFGETKMKELVTQAGYMMGGWEREKRPILPAIFGHKTKEKIFSNGKDAWRDVAPTPYILSFENIRYMMLSGIQGGGKSNALTQLLCSLIYFTPPEILRLHIVDTKGDAKVFSPIANVITDKRRALYLVKYMSFLTQRKQEYIASKGVKNIAKFNEKFVGPGKGPRYQNIPYDIIIIDEFASTLEGDEWAKESVMHIMERGRSAGVFLIITGQRLDAKVSGGNTHGGRAKANIVYNWSFTQRDSINRAIAGVESNAKGLPVGHSIFNSPNEEVYVETTLIEDAELKNFIENFARLGYFFKRPKKK